MPFLLVTYLVVSTLSATDSKRPEENPSVPANTEASKPRHPEAKSRLRLDDPELVQRLNPEQIVQLMREQEITARERNMPRVPAIATISVIALFGFLGVVIVAGLWISALRDRRKHETLRAIIEKGSQIPPELLAGFRSPFSDFRRGIILIASGVGLSILLVSLHLPRPGAWTVGLIPGLIGVGYLIAWYFQRREKLQGVHPVS